MLVDENQQNKGDGFNFARKVYHLGGLVIPIFVYLNLFDYFQLQWFKEDTRSMSFFTILAVWLGMLILEYLRFNFDWWRQLFLKTFGRLLKPKELNKIQGSIPFLLANAIIVGFFPRETAVIAIIFLSFGDPAAAFFGSKYGTIRFKNRKSLQGVVGGLIVGFLVALIFLVIITIFEKSVTFFHLWTGQGFQMGPFFTVLAGAVSAALIELVSRDGLIDDNMTIPVTSAVVMTLVMAAIEGNSPLHYLYSFRDLITLL